MYTLCRAIAALLFIVGRRIRFYGRDEIPERGPVLIIANHTSMLDPIIVGLASKRRFAVMAKKELFEKKVIGWFLRTLGGFPVDREESDRTALRRSLSVLNEGGVLILFPEGTRNESPGGLPLLPFKNGSAYLASQVPACTVVPIGIHGSDRLLKYFRKPVEVYIGSSMEYKVGEGESKREALDRFLKEQEDAVTALLEKNHEV